MVISEFEVLLLCHFWFFSNLWRRPTLCSALQLQLWERPGPVPASTARLQNPPRPPSPPSLQWRRLWCSSRTVTSSGPRTAPFWFWVARPAPLLLCSDAVPSSDVMLPAPDSWSSSSQSLFHCRWSHTAALVSVPAGAVWMTNMWIQKESHQDAVLATF